MHVKGLYHALNKVMCHWINRTCRVDLIDIHYMVSYRAPKKMYYRILSTEIEAMFTNTLCINCAILLHLYGYDEKLKILIIFL